MSFRVHSFCCYPGSGVPLTSPRQWAAKWFVLAVKGAPVKGTSTVPALSGAESFDLRSDTREAAGAWFAEKFVERGFSQVRNRLAFVPVPCHDCDTPAKVLQCAVGRLAITICGLHAGWVCDPLLWFREPVASARNSGPRWAEQVHPLLEIGAPKYPGLEVILLDDVKTTGGHLRAAEAKLRGAGVKVRAAVCLARTVGAMPEEPFAHTVEELESYEP